MARAPRRETGRLPARPPSVSQRTMVFDEIDTGIGGRAAEAVGKKLKALACANQVLWVGFHLPQIATFADHHFVIEKKELQRPHADHDPRCRRRRAHRRGGAHVERS